MKKIKKKKLKRWFSYVIIAFFGTIVLMTLVYLIWCAIVICSIFPSEKDFDRNVWIENSDERIFMVDDMLSDFNNLEEMTRDEVIAVLGNDYMEEYPDENLLSYYLGFGGGFSTHPSTLDISFENNRVVGVVVIEH